MKNQWLGLFLIPALFFGCSGETDKKPTPTPNNPIKELLSPTITPVPTDAEATSTPTPSAVNWEALNEAINKKGEISALEVDFFTKNFPSCAQIIREYNQKNKQDAVPIAEAFKDADWINQLKGFSAMMRSYIHPRLTSADAPTADDVIKSALDNTGLRTKLEKSNPDSYNTLLELEKKYVETRIQKWVKLQQFLYLNGVDGYNLFRVAEKICEIHAQIPEVKPTEPPIDPDKIPEVAAAKARIKELTKEKELIELSLTAPKLSEADAAIIKKVLSDVKNKLAEQEKIITNNLPAPKTPNPPVRNPLKDYEKALIKAMDEAVRPTI